MPNIESGLGHASLSAMGIDFEDKELVRTLLAVPFQPLDSDLNVLAAQVQAAGLAPIGTPIGAGGPHVPLYACRRPAPLLGEATYARQPRRVGNRQAQTNMHAERFVSTFARSELTVGAIAHRAVAFSWCLQLDPATWKVELSAPRHTCCRPHAADPSCSAS